MREHAAPHGLRRGLRGGHLTDFEVDRDGIEPWLEALDLYYQGLEHYRTRAGYGFESARRAESTLAAAVETDPEFAAAWAALAQARSRWAAAKPEPKKRGPKPGAKAAAQAAGKAANGDDDSDGDCLPDAAEGGGQRGDVAWGEELAQLGGGEQVGDAAGLVRVEHLRLGMDLPPVAAEPVAVGVELVSRETDHSLRSCQILIRFPGGPRPILPA